MVDHYSEYGIGDTVFNTRFWGTSNKVTCELCKGKKNVEVVGSPLKASCPSCRSQGYTWGKQNISWYAIQSLTIGLVNIVAGPKKPKVSYMAEETGVGSGTIYYEDQLYSTHEDALAACSAIGAKPYRWAESKVVETSLA